MKLTELLQEINNRENDISHIKIYSDGSGRCVTRENGRSVELFGWGKNNDLPKTILTAFKEYKGETEGLTL